MGDVGLQPFDIIDNFRLIKPIGIGGFGEIYFARDNSLNIPFALKFVKDKSRKQLLELEADVLSELKGCHYFPQIEKIGIYHNYAYISMELLGPSLSAIRKALDGKHLSSVTVYYTALQTLNIIQELHIRGFVHRDIKPSNFLIHLKHPRELALIDFGLAKRHIDPKTNLPHPPMKSTSFVGTIRYASINAHKHKDLGRADDLISWIYSIIELAKGGLPWQTVADKELVALVKERTPVSEVCAGMPLQYMQLLEYLYSLDYNSVPDYDYIREKLKQTMNGQQAGWETTPLDWEKLSNRAIASISAVPYQRTLSDTFDGAEPAAVAISDVDVVRPQTTRSVDRHLLVDNVESPQNCCGFCIFIRKLFCL